MFIVDKIVEEDRCMLLANELKSITPPDRTTQVLDPGAAHNVVVIFEDLCLLGNGECPQFLQLEYPCKMFALWLIESVLTNYHKLFHKVCLLPFTHPRPVCHQCPQITVMFTAFLAHT
jgi:Guanine nucleotide exchange factor in Golgi transport N-terminal